MSLGFQAIFITNRMHVYGREEWIQDLKKRGCGGSFFANLCQFRCLFKEIGKNRGVQRLVILVMFFFKKLKQYSSFEPEIVSCFKKDQTLLARFLNIICK